MRIVAGKFAGRNLVSPQGSRVRPTAETVRVAMMDILRDDIPKARILDLFAGTGALGLEAISRGAAYADFVEFRPDSLHSLKANIAALRLLKNTRIYKKDALPFAAALDADKYDITFADPPYGSRMLDRVIDSWKERRFSRILAVEHAADHKLPRGDVHRVFEDTAITLYHNPG
jgi:16S rRNA (guanine966-N2)-methyltransferase